METSLFKTPFPGRNSVPPSFVSFFVFYIFSYLLSKSWIAFLGASCPLPAFRSCFVEFTRRLNALLMNLWGRKCSPRPTPPPLGSSCFHSTSTWRDINLTPLIKRSFIVWFSFHLSVVFGISFSCFYLLHKLNPLQGSESVASHIPRSSL